MEDGLFCNTCIVMNSTNGICLKKKKRERERSKTDCGIVMTSVDNAKFVSTFQNM